MTPYIWTAIGFCAGTIACYVLAKKKDFRTGLSVGVGAAVLAVSLLQYLF
jgi:hypothetical protein